MNETLSLNTFDCSNAPCDNIIHSVWYNVIVPKIAVFYNQKMLWEYSEWRTLAFRCSIENDFFMNSNENETLEVHYLIFARFRGSKLKYDTRQIQSLLAAQMDKLK